VKNLNYLAILTQLLNLSVAIFISAQGFAEISAPPSPIHDFTIFNPTPSDKMREFNPDRPGATNMPYTIDPGHMQIETEFFNYSKVTSYSTDINDGTSIATTTSQTNWMTTTIRLGLTNSTEAGFTYAPYIVQNITTSPGENSDNFGHGDFVISFKRNFYGNDGGPVSWALMPSVKIPSASDGLGNKLWEPSLMVPIFFAVGEWGISIMPEVDFRKNSSDDSMHSEFNSPFNIGHNLFGPIDGYAEIVLHTSNERDATSTNTIGFGITWKPHKETQLDLGCSFGTNSSTPNFTPSAGLAVRF
jgi:hypothetical protein